jgi:hypothetical protein
VNSEGWAFVNLASARFVILPCSCRCTAQRGFVFLGILIVQMGGILASIVTSYWFLMY